MFIDVQLFSTPSTESVVRTGDMNCCLGENPQGDPIPGGIGLTANVKPCKLAVSEHILWAKEDDIF